MNSWALEMSQVNMVTWCVASKKEGKTPKIDELSPFLSTCRTKIVISGDIP
jgi:uncharacterized membrane protein YhdT